MLVAHLQVLNHYFDSYFPLAAKTGATLMKETGMPLRWMTFSYIVSLYMDCPAGYALHCPNATAKATFVEAVKAQHIVWAGFPTNAELSTGDKSILQFGVKMSQVRICWRFLVAGFSPAFLSRGCLSPYCRSLSLMFARVLGKTGHRRQARRGAAGRRQHA